MRATIKPLDKGFMLMLGEHELGLSKTDFDARFHMHAINAALDAAHQTGRDSVTAGLKIVADLMHEKMFPPK